MWGHPLGQEEPTSGLSYKVTWLSFSQELPIALPLKVRPWEHRPSTLELLAGLVLSRSCGGKHSSCHDSNVLSRAQHYPRRPPRVWLSSSFFPPFLNVPPSFVEEVENRLSTVIYLLHYPLPTAVRDFSDQGWEQHQFRYKHSKDSWQHQQHLERQRQWVLA